LDLSPPEEKTSDIKKDANTMEFIIEEHENHSEYRQDQETPAGKRTRSPFHNFQKHLLTLLRKHVWVRPKTFEETHCGKLAHSLWQIFARSKS
jgi:hypothetical protein